MADLIKKNEKPQKPNNGLITAAVIIFVIAAFFGIAFFATGSAAALLVSMLLLFVGTVLLVARISGGSYYEKTPGKLYGDMGERKAGFILEKYLPDGYTVIQNAKVTYEGHTSEIDNIVVGKTGVFIVEVKNVKGEITGDYEWHNWLQDKIDKYDIEHKREFYSPVKQVRTHIYRLANYLRDNKIFTHINGAVYFANPLCRVIVEGDDNDIPVFTYRSTQALLNCIMSGNADLSEKTVNKIVYLLSD